MKNFIKISLILTTSIAAQLVTPVYASDKNLQVINNGINSPHLEKHTIKIIFNTRIAWTSLPMFNSQFKETLGQSDSDYQKNVDEEIKNFTGIYNPGQLKVYIYNDTVYMTANYSNTHVPSGDSSSDNDPNLLTNCSNTQTIYGNFKTLQIIIDKDQNCTVKSIN